MLGVVFHVCCIDALWSTVFIKCSNASHFEGFYIVAIVHLPEVTLSSHLPFAEALNMAVFGILSSHWLMNLNLNFILHSVNPKMLQNHWI